jgi:Cdc6-like AAA superfamily ATPase
MDYATQQSELKRHVRIETVQKLLDSPEVSQWLNEPRRTLFCWGMPGIGKTTLAAVAIDRLLVPLQRGSGSVGVAYCFCRKGASEQSASSMLAAILKQLLQAQSSIVEPVERLYKHHADLRTMPSLKELFGALRDTVAWYDTVYIVIDALDEYTENKANRHQFLDRLLELQNTSDVRLLVTSRIQGYADEFKDALQLKLGADSSDIQFFVESNLHRFPDFVQHDPELLEKAQKKIVEAADGMYVAC